MTNLICKLVLYTEKSELHSVNQKDKMVQSNQVVEQLRLFESIFPKIVLGKIWNSPY